MSKHTSGPWYVTGSHPRHIHIGAESSPMVLASMNNVHIDTPANAARIVACVNYCEGVPDERLNGRSLESALGTLDSCMEGYNFVAAQRDDLAEALKALLPHVESANYGGSDILTCIEEARAALAKVQP